MQLELGYSIQVFLEDKTGIPSVLIYDGIKLPDEKPFITVEQMQNNLTAISKQNESIATTFRFQLGLYARTHAERSSKQDEIRELFLFEDIPLYNETGGLTSGFFNVSITNEVPIIPEDISDQTRMHRLYFDIEVERISHKNKGEI
ncbi:hypothetical protein SAMN05216389_12110 [Oceanobacillus limi]|uniref:Uncharacterized protein n=1 Tax=Oceanobacillus limi TaxID=930131 RepID=A0A1I0GEF6_9BACI|nr:hypothetical protein [Oceanobacillus limi]SET69193.1 hypothetical protein SAMN05216389_12110 [Oceanobacillus limi]